MKEIKTVLFLLLIFILCTSTQCRKCFKGDMLLNGTRRWLPLKGKTELTFKDSLGIEKQFELKVLDTLQTYPNEDCFDTYRSERIEVILYLNFAKTDSIFVQLGPPSSICLHATSNRILYMSSCRFLNTAGNEYVMPLYNYKVGGRTYSEVRLFMANPGFDKSLDSIVIAKDYGIVGYKYDYKNYSLK